MPMIHRESSPLGPCRFVCHFADLHPRISSTTGNHLFIRRGSTVKAYIRPPISPLISSLHFILYPFCFFAPLSIKDVYTISTTLRAISFFDEGTPINLVILAPPPEPSFLGRFVW